ncbi:hypothetical protein QTP70_025275, partial [Hemibagrus guttatus]
MKCFERVVLAHIQSSILDTLDSLQYTYRPNRSTSDAIAAALHISHLEDKDTYIRKLFIDYSSTFNTILNNFYSCAIESVLTNCITMWYGSTTMRDCKHFQS